MIINRGGVNNFSANEEDKEMLQNNVRTASSNHLIRLSYEVSKSYTLEETF